MPEFRASGGGGDKISNVAPNICGSSLQKFALNHPSSPYNFEVAPRNLDNLCTPIVRCFYNYTFCMNSPTFKKEDPCVLGCHVDAPGNGTRRWKKSVAFTINIRSLSRFIKIKAKLFSKRREPLAQRHNVTTSNTEAQVSPLHCCENLNIYISRVRTFQHFIRWKNCLHVEISSNALHIYRNFRRFGKKLIFHRTHYQ